MRSAQHCFYFYPWCGCVTGMLAMVWLCKGMLRAILLDTEGLASAPAAFQALRVSDWAMSQMFAPL